MKTALFVMVPHVSHYYPTFGLAAALQKRGFRIVYTVAPGFEPVVHRAGFESVPMLYDDEFVIGSVKAATGLLLKNLLDPSLRRQCYRAFRHSVARMESIAAAMAPDLVLLDDTLG
ncbi:MAG: hypothetical protein ICV83_25275, partial [Cytophagales bacterium]|nr:hypothetical protein [Cytophagales bacterium]